MTYFQDGNFTMDLMYKTEGQWEQCFGTAEIKIPSVSYLGFTAHTGDLSDNFDIVSVETKNLYSAGGSTGKTQGSYSGGRSGSTSYQTAKSEGGSWSWFFLKIILFFVVAAGGYVGFTMYRSQRRASRF